MAKIDKQTEDLVRRFRSLALEHVAASEKGDYEAANRAVDMTAEVIRQLWVRGEKKRDALRPLVELTTSDDPRVALKAVVYTAELFPEVESQLHRIARDKGLSGLGAKYALNNIQEGKLRVLKEILGSEMP